MPFTANDYEKLHQLMNSSPEIRELLQKLLDSQQYTISKISHEVRNPLTLIYSTFQLIESSHPETKDFIHWSELREDIEYTISLLQELSAYNNSEHLHLSTFSAQDFLGQICLSFAASCVDTDIGFSSLIAPDLPSLTADRLKLHEAILNLLRNAREAISSAGSIRLEAVLKDQMLQMRRTKMQKHTAKHPIPLSLFQDQRCISSTAFQHMLPVLRAAGKFHHKKDQRIYEDQ